MPDYQLNLKQERGAFMMQLVSVQRLTILTRQTFKLRVYTCRNYLPWQLMNFWIYPAVPLPAKHPKGRSLSFNIDGFSVQEIAEGLNDGGVAIISGHHCTQNILYIFSVEKSSHYSFVIYNSFKMQSFWFLDYIKFALGYIHKKLKIRTDYCYLFYVFRKSGKNNKKL